MKNNIIGIAGIFIFITASACGGGGGSAEVTGDLAGYALRPQTVFAWIDQTKLSVSDDGRQQTFIAREKPSLHVAFSGASFNPASDLRFSSASDRLHGLEDSLKNGDLHLAVSNYQRVQAPANITPVKLHTTSLPGEASSPGLAVTVDDDAPALALEYTLPDHELDEKSEFPRQLRFFASKAAHVLQLKAVDDDEVEGTLWVSLERGPGDPENAITGEMVVKFAAPLIPERLAECNGRVLDLSGVDIACEVDRPVALAPSADQSAEGSTSF